MAAVRILGAAEYGTNDWVDDQLVIALHRDATDYLITEDDGLHRKAQRLGLGDRTLRLRDAVEMLIHHHPGAGSGSGARSHMRATAT